jgi:hypothetical protein
MQERFKVGDKVYKPKGYQFDGTIVSVFKNLKGETRLVAEMDGNGMLHIFNESQLEPSAYTTPTEIILQNEWDWKGHKYNSTYSSPIHIYTKKIRKKVCVLEYDSGVNILTGYTMTDKTVYTEGGALEQKFSLKSFDHRILNDLELNTNW